MNLIKIPFGKPNPLQQATLEQFRQGKRIVLLNSGRQAGKSHFGARWVIAQVARAKAKNKLGAVIAPTFRDARVAVRKVKEVLQLDLALWEKIKYREQPIPTFQFPNGYLLEVHSAHEPDSLRGPTFDFVWFDEIAKASKDAFDIVMPTLLASEGYFLGTTTPRGKQNWVYSKLFLPSLPMDDPKREGNKDVPFDPIYGTVLGSTWDNVENLSIDAISALQRQYGEGSLFERQEVGGDFVSFEGLVYSWDERINYVPPNTLPDIDTCEVVVGGVDFGWFPDPSVGVVLGYKDGVWYGYDGIYENYLHTNDLADELSKFGSTYRVSIWYADSSRPDEIADLLRRGIPVVGVKKPKIMVRVKEFSLFTNNNRFKVSHRIPDVRNELQTYQYEERKHNSDESKPLDKNNHAMDAIGYAVWSVRYLWANSKEYAYQEKHRIKEDIDADEDDPFDKFLSSKARRDVNPAGLYGR